MEELEHKVLRNDPDYILLAKRQRQLSFWFSFIIIGTFGAFIFGTIYGANLFGVQPFGGSEITLGLILTLSVMIFALLLTGLYLRLSRTLLRPLRQKLNQKAGLE